MSTSETIDDGGPAFPVVNPAGMYVHPGMSLLDYFAGQALCGLLSSGNSEVAQDAYLFATQLLNERERIHAAAR